MKKVFVLPAMEDWIVDRFVLEWNRFNSDIVAQRPESADVIWLLADWNWKLVRQHLQGKRVLTSVHHIVPEKFGPAERTDFAERDGYTTAYHVYNEQTREFISSLTSKPIHLIKYWANNHIWRPTGTKKELRKKHGLPAEAFIIGSFQRDTEGHGIDKGLFLPKLEKGPDLFCDAVLGAEMWKDNVHVLLAGWRRQYVISRLTGRVPFTYIERPSQEVVNELYQTLDLYLCTSRCEGGPQSLIECGLLNVPVVSRDVGIASQVLPAKAIADNVLEAAPAVPDVSEWRLPQGFQPYRDLLESL